MRPLLRVLLLGLVLAPGPAGATALFELPPGNPFFAGLLFSDLQHPREAASYVCLDADAEVSRVVWWGTYFAIGAVPSPSSSPFWIRWFADEGGTPAATPLFSAAVTATLTPFPGVVTQFEYTATLPAPVALTGGATYWISILDVDPLYPTFQWRKATEGGLSFSRSDGLAAWSSTAGLASVRLEGTVVPEPGTAALAALGLAGLGARRRGSAAA